MTTEILKAEVTNLISENGTASPFTVKARLAWGPERLTSWLTHQHQGCETYSDILNVCRDLCLSDFNFDD